MRRGIHIAIAVLAILLIAKPFDCFAGGAWTQKAADCCHKGKCTPGPNADECCKGTVPGGDHFLGSKGPDHSSPIVDFASTHELVLGSESFNGDALFVVQSPPGSPP